MSQTSSLPSLVSDELPSLTSHTNSLAAAATMNAGLQREATNEDMSRHTSAFPNQQSSGSPKLDTMNSVERRRKSIAMSLNLNDPALPAPGEMQTSGTTDNRSTSRNFSIPQTRSPGSRSRSSSIANRHHIRQPSVGEVYQEMEQEQEAQVVRRHPYPPCPHHSLKPTN